MNVLQNSSFDEKKKKKKKKEKKEIPMKQKDETAKQVAMTNNLEDFINFENACIVCKENDINLVFLPCGHACCW